MRIFFKLYQKLISPLFHGFSSTFSGNPYNGCKFEPTCSCYCEQAIEKHGLIRGSIKSIWRILRCHPFSKSGGYDPI